MNGSTMKHVYCNKSIFPNSSSYRKESKLLWFLANEHAVDKCAQVLCHLQIILNIDMQFGRFIQLFV